MDRDRTDPTRQVLMAVDEQAGSARTAILEAAAAEFAEKYFAEVTLADVTVRAGVTKGALYFNFPSKRDLALAIIDEQRTILRSTMSSVVNRQLPGVEALIEIAFHVREIEADSQMVTAGVNLIDGIASANARRMELLDPWVRTCTSLLEQGIAEGDIIPSHRPEELSEVLLGLYVGSRQLSGTRDREAVFTLLARSWQVVLPGMVVPERLAYLNRFIDRRLAAVIHRHTATASASTR